MEAVAIKKDSLISFKTAKKLVLTLVFVFIFDFFLFPVPVFASGYQENNLASAGFPEANNVEINTNIIINTLPVNEEIKAVKTNYYEITAYNSDVSQTDGSPCTTANGFNVCQYGIEDTIAANFLPFGAKVKIPDLFGNKIFVVRDRMNSRYNSRIDIWMVNKQAAIKFGYKYAKVEVLEP